MAEYNYTRTLSETTHLYNIDYNGEVITLGEEIYINIFNKTLMQTYCNANVLKVIIEPALTPEEKTTLDNLVANHE